MDPTLVVRQAREGLLASRKLLKTPSRESLEEFQASLEEIRHHLHGLSEFIRAGEFRGGGLPDDLRQLQSELRRVGALVRHAGELNAGWARMFALCAGGYTAEGEAVEISTVRRLSFDA